MRIGVHAGVHVGAELTERYRRVGMSESRTCDARCHNALGSRCNCWCGGLFHGAPGAAAREAFRATFDALPGELAEFEELTRQGSLFDTTPSGQQPARDRWRAALQAARDARRQQFLDATERADRHPGRGAVAVEGGSGRGEAPRRPPDPFPGGLFGEAS